MKAQSQFVKRAAVRMVSLACLSFAFAGCGGGGGGDDNPGSPTSGSGNPTNNNPVATIYTKTTILAAAQESTPVTTTAAGYASFVVDSSTKAISGTVSFTGINATQAHIHLGAAGASGAVAVALVVDNNSHKATVPDGTVLTQEQYDAFLAGELYVNVHSATYPAGEIRGQIGRVVVTANLTGDQETPAVTTAALGAASFAVDPATMRISGGVIFSGVTATAAHVHTGAVGASGAPVVPLDVAATRANAPDAKNLEAKDYAELLDGHLYVNVHSAANAGGEIRGQLGPVAVAALLNAAQETPASSSTGVGIGEVVVDPVTRALTGGINFSGVTSATGAHIHKGAAGAGGPIVVTLALGADGISATVPAATVLTPDQYNDLVAGNYYFNVHSIANPAGDIRGQLDVYPK